MKKSRKVTIRKPAANVAIVKKLPVAKPKEKYIKLNKNIKILLIGVFSSSLSTNAAGSICGGAKLRWCVR